MRFGYGTCLMRLVKTLLVRCSNGSSISAQRVVHDRNSGLRLFCSEAESVYNCVHKFGGKVLATLAIGVREFRDGIAKYLDSATPIAITRHGQTVGYYVPARRKVSDQELQDLKEALGQLHGLMAEYGSSEDEIVDDFRDLHRPR